MSDQSFRSRELILNEETAAAVEDLRAWAAGEWPPNAEAGLLAGRIADFSQRFLAWVYVTRAVIEPFGVPNTVAEIMADACVGALSDDESSEHFLQAQTIVMAQEQGEPDAVDRMLSEITEPTAQGTVLGMAVLTAHEAVRRASSRAQVSKAELLERAFGAEEASAAD